MTGASPETKREWIYIGYPECGTDARKLVTLMQDGMVWVGIRIWNENVKQWQVNGEPEKADVLAWADLPEPANKRWIKGQLT